MDWNAIRLTQAGLSPANESKQAEFNAAVQDAAELIDKAHHAYLQLAGNCEAEWNELETETAKLKRQSRTCWMNALMLVKSAQNLYQSFGPDLIQNTESCEAALRKAEDATRKKLRAAGHAPESSPFFAANPQSANCRFEHLVQTSESCRAAANELEQARHNHRIWTMRRESVNQWPELVRIELQQITARALNLV